MTYVLSNSFNHALALELGERLRTARLDAGLTLAQVATRLRSHRPIIGRTERGAHIPRLDTLIAHACVVGLPLRTVCEIIDRKIAEHRA